MIINSPNEVAFLLFGYPVYWYGIIMAAAVLVGVFVAEFISKGMPKWFFVDNSPFVILFGLLGARLYYCLLNADYYLNYPLQILNIRGGGLSIHGMLLLGVLAVLLIAKFNKISFWKVLDPIACAVPLSQAIGRFGNFFNNEAFGFPTNQNWGLFIPVQNRPAGFEDYELFHPAFLYESVLDLIVFVILIFLYRKTCKEGAIFFLYLILYSIVRIAVEQIRIDSVLYIGGFSVATFISVVLLLIGFFGFLIKLRN